MALADLMDVSVVSPVPWFPPLVGRLAPLQEFGRFRQVPRIDVRSAVEVRHPRFLVGPSYRLHAQEARCYHAGVTHAVGRLRRTFPFDLVHAHFSYPDGVVAERIGRRYGVPVVVTEHAPWKPWMDSFPAVRRQVVAAAPGFAAHLAVSSAVRTSIAAFTGRPDRIDVVPIGVDEQVYRRLPGDVKDPDKILFVGLPRPTKGVDLLLEAMAGVLDRRPSAHLVVVGGSVYRHTRSYMAELEALGARPALRGRVVFEGLRSREEVARHMATSGVLVLPSRLESFGAVLIEALACGTPVVSSRSGGPEDVVTEEVGRLVPVGDVAELTAAIVDVLGHQERYPAEKLREFAVGRYSWTLVAEQLRNVYVKALGW